MKRTWVVAIAAITATALVSCGGSGSSGGDTAERSGDISTISVTNSTASGDFTPSVTAGKTATNGLKLTVAGQDVDSDGTVETPTITSIGITSGAAMVVKGPSGDLDCNDGRPVGTGSTDDKFDVGFCLDTTGSMGSASNVLAGKIAAFATELASRGVDAQFVGVTLGDAFATKLTSGSEYSDAISAGPLGVPDAAVDPDERPSSSATAVDSTMMLDILGSDDMATFFNAVKDAPSTGTGGGDGPENYLGCLQYMFDSTSWRTGAGRIMVNVGDNCSHTASSQSFIVAPWTPPAPADFLAAVTGNAVVHVIGNDYTCYSETYNMKGASDATGGTFTEIGSCASESTCNVDLITDVPIVDAISGGTIYDCTAESSTPPFAGSGTYTMTIGVEVTPSGGGEKLAATIVMTILLGFF